MRAAEAAGLARLVVNMAGPVFEALDDPVTRELRAIRAILTDGGVRAVVIQPTSFLDNLTEPWAIGAIVNDGVMAYPAAPDVRISWISRRSLGDFVAAALRAPGFEGRVFDVGGPQAISGIELAAAVGAAAVRPVGYAELPLADFAASLNHAFGPPAGERVAALYRHYRDDPDAGVRDPASWASLDVKPETVGAWAGRQP